MTHSICIPKSLYCSWHIPTFTGGSTPCVLQSFNEIKARLIAGGTFFRSVDVGAGANNLLITSEWYDDTAANVALGLGNLILDSDTNRTSLVQSVKLTITDGSTTTYYYADQSYSYVSSTWSSAIGSLRSSVNGIDPFIEIPPGVDYGGTTTGTIYYDTTSDADHLETFSLNMSGGQSGPTIPGSSIRTGPSLSIIHVNDSELYSTDGSSTYINETRFFNGGCWKIYSVSSIDCVNPETDVVDCSAGPVCP